MPATTNKGYEVQTTGTNAGTWGDLLNTNVLTFVDTNLANVLPTTLASSPVTLSASQARNAMQRLTGTLGGDVQVTNPNIGFWFCENLTTGAFNVTLTNGVGSPVALPQNRRAALFSDGTNGVRILSLAATINATLVPSGSVMLFMQSAVPSGWTLSTAWNDYGIQLSSSAGGTTYGSVAYSVVHARTSVEAHSLTNAESPKHTHSYTLESKSIQPGSGAFDGIPEWAASPSLFSSSVTGVTDGSGGSGAGHSHTFDLRVNTVTGVIGTRAS